MKRPNRLRVIIPILALINVILIMATSFALTLVLSVDLVTILMFEIGIVLGLGSWVAGDIWNEKWKARDDREYRQWCLSLSDEEIREEIWKWLR